MGAELTRRCGVAEEDLPATVSVVGVSFREKAGSLPSHQGRVGDSDAIDPAVEFNSVVLERDGVCGGEGDEQREDGLGIHLVGCLVGNDAPEMPRFGEGEVFKVELNFTWVGGTVLRAIKREVGCSRAEVEIGITLNGVSACTVIPKADGHFLVVEVVRKRSDIRNAFLGYQPLKVSGDGDVVDINEAGPGMVVQKANAGAVTDPGAVPGDFRRSEGEGPVE